RLGEDGCKAEVVPSAAVVGGGGAPGVELDSWALSLPERYAEPLRTGDPAILGRVLHGRLLLDLRAVPEGADHRVRAAVLSVED
ncbi:L-seryl-tRNA(Sec) selenium transferase, partial [Micromonospora sp. NPDC005313]